METPKPKCPVCSSETFTLCEIEPVGSKCKLTAVHCSTCGAVVGMEPGRDFEIRIQALEQKLAAAVK